MRHTILTRAAATLVVAAAAAVPTVASATTSKSGSGTTLSFGANAVGPPVNARIPSSLSFTAPGFTFDPRAVAKHCTHEQAVLNECPAQSHIGVGTLTVHVVSPKFTRDTAIPINIYLQSAHAVLAVAFLGGPHVVPATISTSNGVTLSFNPLPTPPAFPSTTITLDSVSIKLGTRRVVVTRKHYRVHRKRKTIVKRTTYYLIHDPGGCRGPSTSSITMGFADGTSVTLTTPVAC
jgi:hypothetical protein